MMGVQRWQRRQVKPAAPLPVLQKTVELPTSWPVSEVVDGVGFVMQHADDQQWLWLVGDFVRDTEFSLSSQRGQLLLAIVRACNATRSLVDGDFNQLSCEANQCKEYLVNLVADQGVDQVIVMGEHFAKRLLQTDQVSGSLGDAPVLVTLDPGELINRPLEKRRVWNDLLTVLEK